ncbi:AEC family transporter [Cellulomonas fimi]|uniref:Auxin Efflux Carrier n=1 Tax=Cellulomonas fimi (strain ATCC 484 / DSM 20113 / JCM 1341 / CCUG 24087 / LMG 16345 / NBRC 15513 / NCIMB 8980 / NCTC 7547 / NRS-133) TaxID=590998 RepID=F4H147_CELFA|nr:AEC family transporter [Cellulomonas fimi]AEE47416.1 Auxin Efflux Carrier [Cellulomonas fimi ATCC 484]NNH05756.1 AEC family transporter [Cellulomonas fimi]VEH36154.1 auxin efflux carrier [Cellulomonas fimi]
MGAVLTALGTLTAVVAAGWLLGRLGVLGPHAPTVLARVVFTVATPALLLVSIARTDLHVLASRSALATWTSTALVALVAALVLRLVLRRSAGDVTIGTLASSYVNAGNLGLALAVFLLGDPVAAVPALLFQLLVLAPIAFTVLDAHRSRSAAPGTDRARTLPVAAPDDAVDEDGTASPSSTTTGVGRAVVATARRTFSNPIIVGTLAGLVLAALPWDLPDVVYGPLDLVGATAAPLALLTFGMSLAVPAADRERAPHPDLVLAVVLRSAIHPALAALVATALGLDGDARLAVVAMAALPTAQNVLVYAIQYGRGQGLARDAGLVTTLLALPVLLVVTAAL